MKCFTFLFPCLLALRVHGADVAISDLTQNSNPSTNTWIEISDMNATPKSGKYLLTNFVSKAELAVSSLTPTTGSVTVDFSGTSMRTISLSGNVTFAASNLYAGGRVTIRILCDGSSRTLAWNASWIAIGAPLPGSITASKYAEVELISWGTTDADVTVKYAEQP